MSELEHPGVSVGHFTNVLGFDLIEAVRVLDSSHLASIQNWLAEPEFP
jgi:hypothetical protein